MSLLFNKKKSSGVFIPSGNGFTQFNGDIGNGSINQITQKMGYHTDQIFSSVIYHDNKIQYIGMEIFTRNIIFVCTPTNVLYINEKDIRKSLGDFSVKKYFNRIIVTDLLSDGIQNKSMPIDFIARTVNLKDVSKNGMFYSDKIEAYLYFTDGHLSDFHFDDGLFPHAKSLKEFNPTVYNWISEIAYKYWPNNDFNAQKEINIQSEAWANIPRAFGNEFIPLHRTENGGANLHMIRVCHYGYRITLSQFTEINHGRFIEIENHSRFRIYKCGNFTYTFDKDSEDLVEFYQHEVNK